MGGIMPTNLALDDSLINEALSLGQHKTKKAVVTQALEEYIQRRKQLEILDIFNSIEFDETFDYKKQRNKK